MIAQRTSVPPKEGVLLFTLVRTFAPSRGLELGTSVGVSAAYQASAMRLNGKGELVSLEGHRGVVEQAREFWARVGLDNVTAIVGRFDESLPRVLADGIIDYAFIDGNHQEAATIAYFEDITTRASPGALLVFDDIAWSPGMVRAWQRIREDKRVAAQAVAGRIGMVILSANLSRSEGSVTAAPILRTHATEHGGGTSPAAQ
jgi:predicted O-methyltransferase YrrM